MTSGVFAASSRSRSWFSATEPPVGKARIPLRDVSWFHVAGADRGYVIVPMSPRLPGIAGLLRPEQQGSAPHPGPTLTFELPAHRRLRRLTTTVRHAPAKGRRRRRARCWDAQASVMNQLGCPPIEGAPHER
jgi:hypothetical protein